MRQTLRLGRLAGIPLGAHWSVLVIMALLVQGLATGVLPAAAPGWSRAAYWATGVAAALLFLGSLMAHEMAHALVARHYRIRVSRVTLWLLGGVAELEDEAPHARADLFVAAAGPLTSVVAGLVFGAAAFGADALAAPVVLVAGLGWLAAINVVLAIFNLLPGAPLDGGRILRAIVWRIRGDRYRAGVVASRAGVGLGGLLAFGGLLEVFVLRQAGGLWLAVVGWFLASAATMEGGQARVRASLVGRPVRDIMNAYPICGHPEQTAAEFQRLIASRVVHRMYPLRDWYGRPAGLVRLADVGRADPLAPLTRLAVAAGGILTADRPATDVLPLLRRDAPVLVTDGGVLVGMVTAADLMRLRIQNPSDRSVVPTV
jgi:Zn-dependent protease/CBS domain-containing protein